MTEELPGSGAPGPGARALVIANPTAGGRDPLAVVRLAAGLASMGCRVEVRDTARRGDAADMACAASLSPSAPSVIVAVGGDGTISEVVEGLMRGAALRGGALPGPGLAILPLGTTNVLARELGLSRNPDDLLALIAGSAPRPMHVGRVGDRHFTVMASAGFDARVIQGVSLGLKRWCGRGAYVLAALAELARPQPARYVVEFPGGEAPSAEVGGVVVAKGRYYGGSFVCARQASVARRSLHVCLFGDPGRLGVLRYAARILGGSIERAGGFRIVEAESVLISGLACEPVQADGDIVGRLPVRVTLADEPLMVWGRHGSGDDPFPGKELPAAEAAELTPG